MENRLTTLALAAIAASAAAASAFAQQGEKVLKDKSHEWRGIFETPVVESMVDYESGACAFWVDGGEKPFNDQQNVIHHVLATRKRRTDGAYGIQFGQSPEAGARHVRIGFKAPMRVDSLYLCNSDTVPSLLRPDAAYPGDMADDSQWIAGERALADGSTTDSTPDTFAFWTFPKGSEARAIRFTSDIPETTLVDGNGKRKGTLGGILIFTNQWDNIAPSAAVSTSSNTRNAHTLNDGKSNIWSSWSNESNGKPISPDNAPEAMLSWASPVTIRGIGLNYPRFQSGAVFACTAPAGVHPRDAQPGDWVEVCTFDGLRSQFPNAFTTAFIDFGRTVETRGLKIRITEPMVSAFPEKIREEHIRVETSEHNHVAKTSDGGKIAFLDEILVLAESGAARAAAAEMAAAAAAAAADDSGVPIAFDMPFDGYATLVVEDADGKRVRNLVSAKPFRKGRNTVRWDATDDLGRDIDAANHGLYSIPQRPVAPGEYTVRGLVRETIRPIYEFTVYNAGDPAWCTPDHTGGWLANHSAPQAACFLPPCDGRAEPRVVLGANVTEGPDGLIEVDLEGRKLTGRRWVGGTWTAAAFLAHDAGDSALPRHQYYVGSLMNDKNGGPTEFRITAIGTDGREEKVAALQTFKANGPGKLLPGGGIAVRNGVLAASLTASNNIAVIEIPRNKASTPATSPTRLIPFASPRGLAFSADGTLFVLGSNRVARVDVATGTTTDVATDGVEDPRGIAVAPDGRIFVSCHGSSHQVKVFAPDGRLIRAIGHAGAPATGPYDPLHMNSPYGIAIDSSDHLWVAEYDYLPKRISVWDASDGSLVDAFYGPPKYGAGGTFDSGDPSRFYYDENSGLMEFFVDWEAGTNMLRRVLFRNEVDRPRIAGTGLPQVNIKSPQFALYTPATDPRPGDETIPGEDGVARRRILANSFNSSPTQGSSTALAMAVGDGRLAPVAFACAIDPRQQPGITNAVFDPLWQKIHEASPISGKDKKKGKRPQAFLVWSDRDDDGRVSVDECQFLPGQAGGVVFQDDASITVSVLRRQEGAVSTNNPAVILRPVAFTPRGTPLYDVSKADEILMGSTISPSTGGNQMLVDREGNALVTTGVRPLPTHSIAGGREGHATWSYPNLWPGLHAGHHSPTPPREKGRVTAATRLCGGFLEPRAGEAGPVCAINGNHGDIYLFTSDGLFVDAVFEDARIGRRWGMPKARRGMDLTGLTPYDEHFWPTFNRAPDGSLCLVCNKDASCVVRLDGIESVRRVAPAKVKVTAADLARIAEARERREAMRRANEGTGRLVCTLSSEAPEIDGSIAEWDAASFVPIESRGQAAYFNADSKPYDLRGALRATPTHLYAAWKTQGVKDLAKNSGERMDLLFKTGGGCDLMLATVAEKDPAARRANPARGDVRILAAMVDGKPRVMMFRPVAPDAPAEFAVDYTSPVSSLRFDHVEEITDRVVFAAGKNADYELAIPLDLLGMKLEPGMMLRGDIGVLRGSGDSTIARLYWCNRATAIVSDVPSEAALQPGNWGVIEVR